MCHICYILWCHIWWPTKLICSTHLSYMLLNGDTRLTMNQNRKHHLKIIMFYSMNAIHVGDLECSSGSQLQSLHCPCGDGEHVKWSRGCKLSLLAYLSFSAPVIWANICLAQGGLVGRRKQESHWKSNPCIMTWNRAIFTGVFIIWQNNYPGFFI